MKTIVKVYADPFAAFEQGRNNLDI